MKRKDIPNMTPHECQDELVMLQLEKLIKRARRLSVSANEAQKTVSSALEDMCIDIDVHSDAENADCLGDAVSCYIQYGEFGLKNLMNEIRTLYVKGGDSDGECVRPICPCQG